MKRFFRVLMVLGALLLVGAGILFWFQNAARTTQLSLNLGFAAWEMAQPVQVPALVATSAGAGFLAGSLVFGWLALSATRRARRAERLTAFDGAERRGPTHAEPPSPVDGWK